MNELRIMYLETEPWSIMPNLEKRYSISDSQSEKHHLPMVLKEDYDKLKDELANTLLKQDQITKFIKTLIPEMDNLLEVIIDARKIVNNNRF